MNKKVCHLSHAYVYATFFHIASKVFNHFWIEIFVNLKGCVFLGLKNSWAKKYRHQSNIILFVKHKTVQIIPSNKQKTRVFQIAYILVKAYINFQNAATKGSPEFFSSFREINK